MVNRSDTGVHLEPTEHGAWSTGIVSNSTVAEVCPDLDIPRSWTR